MSFLILASSKPPQTAETYEQVKEKPGKGIGRYNITT